MTACRARPRFWRMGGARRSASRDALSSATADARGDPYGAVSGGAVDGAVTTPVCRAGCARKPSSCGHRRACLAHPANRIAMRRHGAGRAPPPPPEVDRRAAAATASGSARPPPGHVHRRVGRRREDPGCTPASRGGRHGISAIAGLRRAAPLTRDPVQLPPRAHAPTMRPALPARPAERRGDHCRNARQRQPAGGRATARDHRRALARRTADQ